jgi:hypothetical protein
MQSRHSNANCPKRPSQNEFRKRAVQVRNSDCGAVEQQSNEATKLCRLGCLVPWLFKRVPVRRHQISVIAPPRACGPRPVRYCSSRQGQPDNSPAFQRRVFAGTGTSPAGTAERTSQCSRHVPPFHPANLCRPSETCIDFTTNPALKCRAIVITSLCDGQTPIAPILKKRPPFPKAACVAW